MPCVPALPASEIERVFREEYGRAVAVLVRVFRDIDVAEAVLAYEAAIARTENATERNFLQHSRQALTRDS